MFTFIYAYLGSLTFYELESKSQAEVYKQNNQHLILPLGSCFLSTTECLHPHMAVTRVLEAKSRWNTYRENKQMLECLTPSSSHASSLHPAV